MIDPRNWRVHLVSGGNDFRVKVYIYRFFDENGAAEHLYPTRNGENTTAKYAVTDDPDPSFVFPIRDGTQILRAFAEALVEHGYTVLDQAGVTAAKNEHIKSLEEQAKRLFTLAERQSTTVKAP